MKKETPEHVPRFLQYVKTLAYLTTIFLVTDTPCLSVIVTM